MLCIRITPWGEVVPALIAEVSDSPKSGQTLHLLFTDSDGSTFQVGPDLMPHCWTQREIWPLGFLTLREIGQDPGYLILVDYQDRQREIKMEGPLKGNLTTHVDDCIRPGTSEIIGSIWSITPEGELVGKNWSIKFTKTYGLLFHPLFGGQKG